MADNVELNAGSGGAVVATDQDVGLAHHQYMKMEWGPDNTQTKVDTGASALPIQDGGNSITVDNGGTFATQASQSGTWNINNVSGTVSLPTGAATAAKQPALGTAGTASADVITVQGIASMTALKVDGSAVTQPVSASSLPLPTGASTAAKQPALGTAGTASADVITVQGITSMTPLLVNASGNAVPVTDNSGSLTVDNGGTFAVQAAQSGTWTVQPGNTANTTAWKVDGSAVTQPVSLASVPSHNVTNAGTFATQAAQSGTWTVQPGNTANTTAWLVSDTPVTSGGCSNYHVVAAASTNTANIKASAGQVYGWAIFNAAAYNVYVKLHNTSGTPTAGSGVIKTIGVPAGGGNNIDLSKGIAFGTGIGISIVKDIADAGTTAVAASDCVVDIHYK